MRVVTYNVWLADDNFDKRMDLLSKVLKESCADIVALQEVRDENVVRRIGDSCGFGHTLWKRYYDWNEGMAILSKYPIIDHETNWEDNQIVNNSFVLRAVVDCGNIALGITNVHLDYQSALNREVEITKTVKMIESHTDSNYELLLGDFNCYPNSSVHRYLTGQQALHGHATSWIDLAEAFDKTESKVTLDFRNNPRWDHEKSLSVPGRFDWIMLRDPYPESHPELRLVDVIGDKREANITPSDHYGVVCDLDFRPTWP